MGVFSVKKSAKNMAHTYENLATDMTNRLRDYEFGQSLLSNIRQQRMARSSIEMASASDDIVSSTATNAVSNINSSLAGEAGYAYTTSEMTETIQDYQNKAQDYWEEYADSVNKAATAGKIVGTITTAVGSLVGGPVGAAAGAAIGEGITVALGGGHVANSAALKAGVEGTVSAFAQQGLANLFSTTTVPSEATGFQEAVASARESYEASQIASVIPQAPAYGIDPSAIGYGSLVDNSSSMFRGVLPFRSITW